MVDTLTDAQLDSLTELYIAYFARAPENDGLNFHTQKILDQLNETPPKTFEQALSERANQFFTDAQAEPQFTGFSVSQTADEFVSLLYANVLGRPVGGGVGGAEPTAAEKKFWTDQIEAGTITRGAVVERFLSDQDILVANGTTEEKALATAAQALFKNRTDVGREFAKAENSGGLKGADAFNAGKKALELVTTDPASVATAVATFAGTNNGQTFTLTSNTDVIAGTAGNDKIIGDFSGTNPTTNAGDSVDGGAGTDTLDLFGTFAAANLPGTIKNVENVNLGSAVADANLNFTNILNKATQGVENISIADASALNAKTVTISGDQTLSLATGSSNGATAGAVTVAHSATDTEATLTLNGYQGGTGVTGQALTATGAATKTYNLNSKGKANETAALSLPATAETVNINAETALNVTGTMTAAAAKSVNVSGEGKVTIAASDFASTVAVDASKSTGGVNYTAEAAGSTLTFTGGSGNDSVGFAAGTLTTADKLEGGAGTDTLVINDTTPVYTAINAATGFETLALGTTGATVDVSKVTNGITSYKVNAGNLTETFNNAVNATAVTIDNSTGNTGAVNINAKTGENTANVTVDAGAATAVQTLATLAFTGVQTVNLNSTGTGTGAANTITNTNTADNSNIVVTGDKALVITNAIDGTAVGSKVDASGFNANLTVTGSGFNDILTGGSKVDTFDGGAGIDTISGGAGKDVISVTAANQQDTLTGGADADDFTFSSGSLAGALATSAGTTGIVKITDFEAGTDKISLVDTGGNATSFVLSNSQTIASAANLTDVYAGITAIAASVDGGALSGAVVNVTAGAAAGTYLYVNDATAGVSNANDMLVEITGITGTFAATDVTFS